MKLRHEIVIPETEGQLSQKERKRCVGQYSPEVETMKISQVTCNSTTADSLDADLDRARAAHFPDWKVMAGQRAVGDSPMHTRLLLWEEAPAPRGTC